MMIMEMHSRINDLFEQYREIEAALKPHDETKRLIDDCLYFSSELMEIIEQLKTDELKNN